MTIWLNDPKKNEPSVSLSLLAISFVIASGAIIMNILKYTENTSSSMELLLTCASLYFGRRMSFGTKDLGSDKKDGQ